MRPHNPLVRSKAHGVARARMLFKDSLAWLRGFPLGQVDRQGTIPWLVVPAVGSDRDLEEIAIDRERLRKATFASRRLFMRFPRALPRLVGNKEEWFAGVSATLDWLKAAVHRGEALPAPGNLVQTGRLSATQKKKLETLAKAAPDLSPLLDALVWMHCRKPADLRVPLALATHHAERFVTVLTGSEGDAGLRLLIEVCDLAAALGARRLDGLIDALGDERVYRTPLRTPEKDAPLTVLAEELIDIILEMKSPPRISMPSAELPAALRHFVGRLRRLPPTVQRSCLLLFDRVRPRELLTLWSDHWEKVHRLVTEATTLIRKKQMTGRLEAAWRCQRKVERVQSLTPPSFPDPAKLMARLEEMATGWSQKRLRNAAAILGQLPEKHEGIAVRASFPLHWRSLEKEHPQTCRLLDPLLETTRRMLRDRKQPAAVLGPWHSALEDSRSWRGPEQEFLDGSLDGSLLPELERAVRKLVPQHTQDPELGSRLRAHWIHLVKLLDITRDGDQAARIVECVATNDPTGRLDFDREELEIAHLLSRTQPLRFTRLLGRLHDASIEPDKVADLLLLVRTVDSPGILEEALLHGEVPNLIAVAGRLALLLALRGNTDTLPRLSRQTKKRDAGKVAGREDWLGRYPEKLQGPLRTLARVDPDARRHASRILGSSFPDPARLERELEALRRELESAAGKRASSMQARLESLETRLRKRSKVSDQRLRNYGQKIRRRVALARLRAWDDTLSAALDRTLAELPGFEVSEEWLENGPRRDLLCAIGRLPRSFRELGFRVLAQRSGAPPRDLREAPENRAFTERLQTRGIDAAPWLDGIKPLRYTTKSSVELTLALEDDPLEVLRMGEHFDTCLRPGSFNFFSAVTNAADINKRVVYARDPKGTVQGRCLLALTLDGRLLTFNPYTHDSESGFKEKVAEFAGELAHRMGTTLTRRGDVETLVAKEWYDDGPRDLTGRFRFLEPDSSFRQSLSSTKSEDFLEKLEAAMAPDVLDEHAISLVLQLEELEDSPCYVRPLVPTILSLPQLELGVILRAATLLRKGFENSTWLRSIEWSLLKRCMEKLNRENSWHAEAIARELIELEEYALALRVLRRTRERRVRRWADELFDRLILAARAHERLGRVRQALALYRKLLERYPTSTSESEWQAAVDRLEERLGGGRRERSEGAVSGVRGGDRDGRGARL